MFYVFFLFLLLKKKNVNKKKKRLIWSGFFLYLNKQNKKKMVFSYYVYKITTMISSMCKYVSYTYTHDHVKEESVFDRHIDRNNILTERGRYVYIKNSMDMQLSADRFVFVILNETCSSLYFTENFDVQCFFSEKRAIRFLDDGNVLKNEEGDRDEEGEEEYIRPEHVRTVTKRIIKCEYVPLRIQMFTLLSIVRDINCGLIISY